MSRVLRIAGVVVVALCAMLGFFLLSGPTSAAPRCAAHCGPLSGVVTGAHARNGASDGTTSDTTSNDTTSAGYAGVALIGVAAIGFVLLTGSTLLVLAGRRHRVAA